MSRTLTYAQSINEALHQAMEIDENVICYGLGVPDPKGVFGTTVGLHEQFGGKRVFDMPASENAMTGVAIGAALNGIRPVMIHQRADFFLLAMDQLVNNAAKWHYMFGGHGSIPITIRLVVGRGWGQGPTHSQHLQAWFAQVPGLKVVMPTTPADAKGLLLSSIFDDNPVVFIEHRWLHEQLGDVPCGDYRVPLGEPAKVRDGDDLTIVSMSYMTVEALRATDYLVGCGIECDLIDLRTISPLNLMPICESVRKTGRLLCLDTSVATCSVSGEIVARIAEDEFSLLKASPRRIALPSVPTPTSSGLTMEFYPSARNIAHVAAEMTGISIPTDATFCDVTTPHDIPGDWFKGPF